MINFKRPVIVIAGPTATGKTDIALRLARDINGVIINADSRQVYKEISIGTAKPSNEEMGNISHYLFGHISVKDQYNLFRYQRDVQEILDTLDKSKTPILVGGTGLYIDSIVYNYLLTEKNIDREYRERLSQLPLQTLQEMVDQEVFGMLNESEKKNPVRLVRAIEEGRISQAKGEPLTHLYFVTDKEKEVLKERIARRIDIMMQNGLIEENKYIREHNLYTKLVQNTICYQEFDEYFENQKSIEQVKKDIIQGNIRYAKKQRTWFKRNKDARWTDRYDQILESSRKLIAIE